jgi:hypothetical protein
MTNRLGPTTAVRNSRSLQTPGNLTLSVDSSKRLDHFVEKLLLCHSGYLLVKREAFHDAFDLEEHSIGARLDRQLRRSRWRWIRGVCATLLEWFGLAGW